MKYVLLIAGLIVAIILWTIGWVLASRGYWNLGSALTFGAMMMLIDRRVAFLKDLEDVK